MKRETSEERATEMLTERDMTRYELQLALGLEQQRTAEVLRRIEAVIVGYRPAPGKGRPAPIYSMGASTAQDRPVFARAATSVFDLAGALR